MRIAQVAPLYVRIPPPSYGGTERVVHGLTEGLVGRGHQVTLFGPGGSLVSAELHATSPRPLWEMDLADPLAYRVLQVEELVRRSAEFDVIHSHLEYLPWLAGERLQAPVLTTLHSRLDSPELRPLFAAFRGWPLVSISDAQRRPLLDLELNWFATVHHGLDLESAYSLGDGAGGYLAFLGRIAPEKDIATAIRVALRLGLPLKIAARVDPADQPYFEAEVRPHLQHPLIQWVGEQDDAAKNELLGGALALLLPVAWDEPFGLTFIEALACGTPVVSRPRGSLPEIVRHGEHGFLVSTEDEMVDAVRRLPVLDRAACRRWALEQFTSERMVEEYESLYRRLAAEKPGRPEPPATSEPELPQTADALAAV